MKEGPLKLFEVDEGIVKGWGSHTGSLGDGKPVGGIKKGTTRIDDQFEGVAPRVKPRTKFTPEEDAFIRENMTSRTGITHAAVAAKLGRTRKSVAERWLLLRKDGDPNDRNSWKTEKRAITLAPVRCLSE